MKSKGQFNTDRVCVLKGVSCGFWRTSERKARTHQGKQHHELRTSFFLRLVLLPTAFDTLLLPSQAPYILSAAPFFLNSLKL